MACVAHSICGYDFENIAINHYAGGQRHAKCAVVRYCGSNEGDDADIAFLPVGPSCADYGPYAPGVKQGGDQDAGAWGNGVHKNRKADQWPPGMNSFLLLPHGAAPVRTPSESEIAFFGNPQPLFKKGRFYICEGHLAGCSGLPVFTTWATDRERHFGFPLYRLVGLASRKVFTVTLKNGPGTLIEVAAFEAEEGMEAIGEATNVARLVYLQDALAGEPLKKAILQLKEKGIGLLTTATTKKNPFVGETDGSLKRLSALYDRFRQPHDYTSIGDGVTAALCFLGSDFDFVEEHHRLPSFFDFGGPIKIVFGDVSYTTPRRLVNAGAEPHNFSVYVRFGIRPWDDTQDIIANRAAGLYTALTGIGGAAVPQRFRAMLNHQWLSFHFHVLPQNMSSKVELDKPREVEAAVEHLANGGAFTEHHATVRHSRLSAADGGTSTRDTTFSDEHTADAFKLDEYHSYCPGSRTKNNFPRWGEEWWSEARNLLQKRIGGFHGQPPGECFKYWVQVAAFEYAVKKGLKIKPKCTSISDIQHDCQWNCKRYATAKAEAAAEAQAATKTLERRGKGGKKLMMMMMKLKKKKK